MKNEDYLKIRLGELMGYPGSEIDLNISEEEKRLRGAMAVYSENYPLVVGFPGMVVSSRETE